MDELLRSSSPSSGDEQPVPHGSMACRHGQDRGGEGCGYAASLGQRKRVAHIPTAEAEATTSGLIFLEGQEQALLHLKSKPRWSHQWGPVQSDPFEFSEPIQHCRGIRKSAEYAV